MGVILIIDDNETVRDGLAHTIRKMGHTALTARNGGAGLAVFRERSDVDFVVTDLKMEGLDGVELLRQVQALDPDAITMIITAYGTVETAVEAMKLGAFDFLTKPFAPEVVRLKVERALELRAARRARAKMEAVSEYLRAETERGYGEIVGESPVMRRVFATLDKVAATDSALLVTGESGTGKELVARAVHARSRRAGGPFIRVNCGSLPESLLDSELFGHERGAFTGAVKRKLGRFELADDGTLFLDEIGDVPPALQLRLLRAMQEKEIERVGGETTLKVDVRVVSATHRDLKEAVARGAFREDLYYRLHVVPIHLPPLRERREDIPLLCAHFLAKLGPRIGRPGTFSLSDEALGRLMAYAWPGNVRELENVLEQAMVLCEQTRIDVGALPPALAGGGDDKLDVPPGELPLPEILEELEKQLIKKAYDKAGKVKTETARLLGIKPGALYYKLEKYRIG